MHPTVLVLLSPLRLACCTVKEYCTRPAEDSVTLADVWLMSDAESDHGSWDNNDPLSLEPEPEAEPVASALPTATREYRLGDRVYWKKSLSNDRDKKHVRYGDRGRATGVDRSDGTTTIYVKFGDSEAAAPWTM